MAQKTKHRILMTVVAIALTIIILPFFQSAKELASDRLSVKAPPFPEPILDVSHRDTDVSRVSAQTTAEEAPPQDLFSVTRPSIISYRWFHMRSKDHPMMTTPTSSQVQSPVNTPMFMAHPKAMVVHDIMDEAMLSQVKNTAWVIQMGSFKNKNNALHLANDLRANGYSAFIQQVATTFGESTRVFVGPESRLKAVHSLVGKIENDVHLRGIIISYQPLKL